MKDLRSLHLKVQELMDCFAATDYLQELSRIQEDTGSVDQEETALKWLALAVLYGITERAKKISLTQSGDGAVRVVMKSGKTEIPSPGPEIGRRIIESIRGITHIEEDKGEIPLALGIRDSSIQISVKVKKKADEEKVSLKFPDWSAS